MVLESLPLEKNTSRTIHVLKFSADKNSFNMGRGHESEVRVNDISVSRCHAIIKYHPDGICIEDNKSKFGTLVLLKDKYPLNLEYTSAVQVGRTVVSFTVRNNSIDKTGGNQITSVATESIHKLPKNIIDDKFSQIQKQFFSVEKTATNNLSQQQQQQQQIQGAPSLHISDPIQSLANISSNSNNQENDVNIS